MSSVTDFASPTAASPINWEHVRKYAVPGPRYTSYPTAPSFRDDFHEREYRRAARESNDDPIPRLAPIGVGNTPVSPAETHPASNSRRASTGTCGAA